MTTAMTLGTAPRAIPLLGHALQLRKDPLTFLTSLSRHGDLVRIRLGPWNAYVACHPELAWQVLVDDRTFDKGGPIFDKAQQAFGNGLVTCPHRDHRRQRRLTQPAFHSSRLPDYAQVMTAHAEETAAGWHDGQILDVAHAMYATTTKIAAATLASAKLGNRTIDEINQAIDAVMDAVFKRMLMPPLADKLPTRGRRHFIQGRARLRTVIGRIITEYRASGIDHGDLLSMLLLAQDGQPGGKMTDNEICDQAINVLAGGIEATAAAVSWAFHLLASNPDVEERMHAELSDVLGGRPAEQKDLPALGLTSRIVTETLRLYPPVWLLTRTVTRETQLAGHRLVPGATVAYSPYILHHRADLFPEPERFDPDRWRGQNAAHLPRGSMIPFGAGSRICIGNTFGSMEVTILLATIASRWRLRPISASAVRPAQRIALSPQNLVMRVQRRELKAHVEPAMEDESLS